MTTKVLFTALLLFTTIAGFSQKQRIKCTNVLISPPDNTWTQAKRSVGLENEDGGKIHAFESERGVYKSLQQFKKDYSDLFTYVSTRQVALAGGGKGFIFKGYISSDEVIIEMHADFPKTAKSFTCKYPKEYDKDLSDKVIKALSSIEIDDTV